MGANRYLCVAVVAGSTIVAEPELIAATADRAKLFVTGVDAAGAAIP